MTDSERSDSGLTPVRVGIIAPCPPPYGGVTRIVEYAPLSAPWTHRAPPGDPLLSAI